jgi:photosystem II stability/assembly factor-like uncharacterized protein
MKKLILLFVISLCLNSFINAQTWRKAFDKPISSIGGGCMVDQNTAWLVGSKQTLLKSTDGGMTWVEKYHADTTAFSATDICFVNSTTAFVSSNYGRILKTIDGGETWQKISLPVPDTTYSVIQIYFFDANLGYTLSTKGSSTSGLAVIHKTTDGGASWVTSASLSGTSIYSMDFSSPTRGIVTGNGLGLYYTADGVTWNKAPTPAYPSYGYTRTDQWSVNFISPTTAISCGWGSMAAGLQPSIFLKTTDAGATWNYLDQKDENKTYVNFYSQYYKDSSNGLAVGGSTYPGTVICRTTDGGSNWVPLPTVSGFTPSVVMGSGNKVILAGGGGGILISTDFGSSWVIVNKHTSETLYSINIVNNSIYACGTSGTFFKSTDMGNTFNMNYMVAANKCLRSAAIQFLNESIGFAVSQRGQVLKTTNAGESWTQIHKDTISIPVSNEGLYFFNENLGFVAGKLDNSVDIIYKTTDGGQSWSTVQNQAYQNLNCIDFADEKNGAAGGNKTAILYTTDQGVSWKTATVNTTDQLDIKAIKFYNGLNGLAVGTSIILKTTDGGATWSRIANSITASLTSVYYVGSTFYIAGGKYCLKSTDEGNTWQNIMDTVYAVQNSFTSLYNIAVDKSGYLWLAGGGGILTNSIASGISEDAIEPNSFSLEQNYPNPFNPSTMISFTNNKRGFVSLKLFDILGREIRVIYKGEMSAGTHKFNFNSVGLASGTYIYSLQVNDQFTCRKMTLLK